MVRTKRGFQRDRHIVLVHLLAELGRLGLATVAPPSLAVVGVKLDRPAHPISDRLAVLVGGVDLHLAIRPIADERDRLVLVLAPWCTSERDAADRVLERARQPVAPRSRLAGVVNLVENGQCWNP